MAFLPKVVETCINIHTYTFWVLQSGFVLQPHSLRHHHVVLQGRTHLKLQEATLTNKQEDRQPDGKAGRRPEQAVQTLPVTHDPISHPGNSTAQEAV